MRLASSAIALVPTASPSTAMPMGSSAAVSDPNARKRTASAARMPTISPALPVDSS